MDGVGLLLGLSPSAEKNEKVGEESSNRLCSHTVTVLGSGHSKANAIANYSLGFVPLYACHYRPVNRFGQVAEVVRLQFVVDLVPQP
jgi:hypothetical protein